MTTINGEYVPFTPGACPVCGSPVPRDDAGKWLVCTGCGRDWYPYDVKVPKTTWTEDELRKMIREEIAANASPVYGS